MDMMATGVRTPVGIRVVSSDPTRLDAIGSAVRARVAALPETRTAIFESLGGETWADLAPDASEMARFGVDPAVVASTVRLLTTGGQVGETMQDGRRLRVRLLPEPPDVRPRGLTDQLRAVTVRAQGKDGGVGQPV